MSACIDYRSGIAKIQAACCSHRYQVFSHRDVAPGQIEKYIKPSHSKDSPSNGAARLDTKAVIPTIAQIMEAILKTLPHNRYDLIQ